MKHFILKDYNASFEFFHTTNNIKEFYNGMYTNVDIVSAIKNRKYNIDTENLVFLDEYSKTPIVTNYKKWEEYTIKHIDELHKELENINKLIKKSNVDMNNKLEIAAFIYQYYQTRVRYYDLYIWSKFPIFDNPYIIDDNNNAYAAIPK